MSRARAHDLWKRFVNPDFVRLLEALGFGRRFVKTAGTKLYDETGREYTDFLAGFGVHNVGHNHPRLIAALRNALESCGASMLNLDAPLEAGLLAERLTSLTHPQLCRTAFANSGAEAVEIAVKAARSATGRRPIVACHGAYHGLTTGAIALLGREDWRRHFVSVSDEAVGVPFGDPASLDKACAQVQPAAFIVEPIQAEGGINVPPPSYLAEAAQICRAHGCLFVVDEIQTGIGRTGATFGTALADVQPDILLTAKALSGGLVPVAAAVMSSETWKRAFSGPERCVLNSSTFAGGRLAMTAGLETLAILEDEGLAARARETGNFLLERLRNLAARHEVIKNVRGRGLLIGVELRPPLTLFARAVPRWARDAIYGQVVSAILLNAHGCVTQPCSLAPEVLRIEPPLTMSRAEIEHFVAALDETLAACPSQGSALVAAFRKAVLGGDV
jgi:acetylornithine/succinyldiaminopimelate/putrescine aminotransferase